MDQLTDSAVLDRIAETGLRQTKRPSIHLAVALIKAYTRCGDSETAIALADEFMQELGRETSFLEARLGAVIASKDRQAARELVDELEPVRVRLPKASWNRLQYAAGQLPGPPEELMQRVDDYLTAVEAESFKGINAIHRGRELLLELGAVDSEHFLLEPLNAMSSPSSRGLARRLRSLVTEVDLS